MKILKYAMFITMITGLQGSDLQEGRQVNDTVARLEDSFNDFASVFESLKGMPADQIAQNEAFRLSSERFQFAYQQNSERLRILTEEFNRLKASSQ